MKKYFLLLLLGSIFISCEVDSLNQYPCPDGNCDAQFIIDIQQNPGSYQDAQGVWHVKYSGLNYFRIKGQTDQLISEYIINGVPKIETGYDSNYFYIPNQITWTYPVYSYLGLFINNNLQTAIPIGYQNYTLPQIVNNTSVSNLAGYEINRYFNFNHPAAKTMLQTYSKYTYTPTQQMVFFPDMIGDTAKIYIRVLWNSDYGGESVERVYELNVKFEN
jgi:hypothetical protein